MEIVPRFKLFDFEARSGVLVRIDDMLESLFELSASDSNCTAVIERNGDEFIFDITVRSVNGLFHSVRRVHISKSICRERLWQVGVVSEMRDDLERQIQNVHQRRFAA